MNSPSSAPVVGRFTALILVLVVIACVAMIGVTGYLKYQLDRAETLLAAPDAAVGSDQDLFDRLRRDLGYGGFLGLAQNYAATHDASSFADMKADIRSADDIVAHLPDRTPAETRHELASIVTTFDAALQKINAPAAENNEFDAADLASLYAALPILDARVSSANAETRLAAQSKMQFWGMLLTLVSWCSLIIAAACAAGIYLTLRDKQSAPMRALAQSIQNMARGDMRTAIWGTERQDMIGELARAVDIARYHFSHLPDLSLLSDQGPVRMKFEGGTRSLFEAMMKAISGDSEKIRDQTQSLTSAVQQQRENISMLSEKVENVLRNILQHGLTGDAQIKQAIHEMVGSAENLKNAHAHAADQLNRMIPTIQERATGMAEIAQITGKQIGQTLQSLSQSEAGLKANADQAKETLARLSSTADDLGARLFGAINLLQASGKVLAETTHNIQGVQTLSGDMQPVTEYIASPALAFDATVLEPLAQQLAEIAAQIEAMQVTMSDRFDTMPMASSIPAMAESIDDQALLSGIEQLLAGKVEPILAAIEQNRNYKSAEAPRSNTGIAAVASDLPAELQAQMQKLQAQIDSAQARIIQSVEQQKAALIDHTGLLSSQTRNALLDMGDKIAAVAAQGKDGTAGMDGKLGQLAQAWADQVQRMIAERIDPKLSSIDQRVDRQAQILIEHSDKSALQTRIALDDVGQKLATVSAQAQGGFNDLGSTLTNMSAALAAQVGHAVADTLDPKLASIDRHIDLQGRSFVEQGDKLLSQTRAAMDDMAQKVATISVSTQGAISDMDGKLSGMASSLSNQLGQMISQHIDPKLSSIDRHIDNQGQSFVEHTEKSAAQIRGVADDLAQKISVASAQTQGSLTHFGAALGDLAANLPGQVGQTVVAQIEPKLATIDRHVDQGLTVVERNDKSLLLYKNDIAALRNEIAAVQSSVEKIMLPDTFALPPEAQKQMADNWFQVAAQIEASRASIERALSGPVASKLDEVQQTLQDQKEAQVPKAAALSVELQKQLHDQWYQMAAQIEAARAGMIESVSDQIARMESKLVGKPQDALSRSAADYSTQRQIEQQTQILGELVSTLSILDAHMQQIKLEMRAPAGNA